MSFNNNQTQTPWGYNQGFNTGFVGGTAFNTPNAVPRMVNPLTEEDKQALKTNDAFTLKITPAEAAAAKCTHKDPKSGQYATTDNPDGTVTCSICHATFEPSKCVSSEDFQAHVDAVINYMQTTKLLGDFSEDVIVGMNQMIPFLRKTPHMFKMAQSSFMNYNSQTGYSQVSNPNAFNLYNGVLTGAPVYPYPGMQQPMQYYGQPMASAQYPVNQQPMQYGQPMGWGQAPNMMQANMVAQGNNPFYASQQPTAPMNQPQPVNQQPQQAAPAQSEDNTVKVNAQMTL